MMLTKLDKRQKVLLGIFGVVLLILIWQIYDLFSNKNETVVIKPVAIAQTGAKPVVAAASNNLPMPPAPTPPGAATAVDPATNAQAEYLRLVNEYQMAQLQRMIAEDNEAIAVAKRNAAQALADTTKNAGSVVTADDNANQNSNAYVLVYTGQQGDGQWTATLKKDGQSFDVIPGRQLPDGSQVASIDENGVLLSQNQGASKLLVTFSGATTLNPDGASTAEANTNADADDSQSANTAQQKVAQAAPAKIIAPVVAPAKPIAPVVTAKAEPTKIIAPVIAPAKPVVPVVTAKAEPAKVSAPVVAHDKEVETIKAALERILTPPTKPVTKTAKAEPAKIIAPINTPSVTIQTAQQKIVTAPVATPVASTSLTIPTGSTITATSTTPSSLQQINSQHYTIQLTSDRALEDVKSFIKMHGLEDKANYFHATSIHGSQWYVGIYGDYASREAADVALHQLPAAVKDEGAFVVSYANVQTLAKNSAPAIEVAEK